MIWAVKCKEVADGWEGLKGDEEVDMVEVGNDD